MGYEELKIEGRNAVLEAFRSGKTIDKLFVLDGCQDGPVRTIVREAKKHDTIVHFVEKERLDQLSETKKHQGVIAVAAAYEYAEVEDMLKLAEEKGEPPFLFILDNIEDPHNLGAIIRTANLAGAHGEGNYYADPKTLAALEANGQVVFRYADNPNGSLHDIAGVTNEAGNVLGMMPHPERAVEALLGGTDGLGVFKSLMQQTKGVQVRDAR